MRGNLPLGADLKPWKGLSYEVPEGAGEPRRSIYGRRNSERGSNRAKSEGYSEGLRLGGDRTRAEGAGERVTNQELLNILNGAGIVRIIPVGYYDEEEEGEKSE